MSKEGIDCVLDITDFQNVDDDVLIGLEVFNFVRTESYKNVLFHRMKKVLFSCLCFLLDEVEGSGYLLFERNQNPNNLDWLTYDGISQTI